MKLKILFFVIAAVIFSAGNGNAQSLIKVNNSSIFYYITDNIIFKDKIDAEAQLWKSRGVKQSTMEFTGGKNDGKVVSHINKNGYIDLRKVYDTDGFTKEEYYAKYKEGTDDAEELEYTDAKDNFRDEIFYKNGRIDRIQSKDRTRDYDIIYFYYTKKSSHPHKIVFVQALGDSRTYLFDYDSKDRLISVTTGSGKTIYSVEYSDDKIIITSLIDESTYEYKNNIFCKLTIRNLSKEETYTEAYTLDENGMRTGGYTSSSNGEKETITISYKYYE